MTPAQAETILRPKFLKPDGVLRLGDFECVPTSKTFTSRSGEAYWVDYLLLRAVLAYKQIPLQAKDGVSECWGGMECLERNAKRQVIYLSTRFTLSNLAAMLYWIGRQHGIKLFNTTKCEAYTFDPCQ
jgi:hypothetical protein